VLLTHMGPEMLANQHEIARPDVVPAHDGLKVEI
jgi:hypothetical protein